MTTIALADDHLLIRNALVELINSFDGFQVIFNASQGREFIWHLEQGQKPDIALIDINMPIMDGFATTEEITKKYPAIKVLALSVDDHETSILRMLRLGAKGYMLKDTDTPQFRLALEQVRDFGFYHSELVTNTLLKSSMGSIPLKASSQSLFNTREEEFMKLICTEYTYKEIASQMNLSPRTIDGYRENLFDKLQVKSRVGLVMFALRQGIIAL